MLYLVAEKKYTAKLTYKHRTGINNCSECVFSLKSKETAVFLPPWASSRAYASHFPSFPPFLLHSPVTAACCCSRSPHGHSHWLCSLRASVSSGRATAFGSGVRIGCRYLCVLTAYRLQAFLAIKAASPPHFAANSKSVFEHIRLRIPHSLSQAHLIAQTVALTWWSEKLQSLITNKLCLLHLVKIF